MASRLIMMDLFIETLTGTAFELRVSPFETIHSVKNKIFRLEGIPVAQQHLVYNDRELADDLSLHDCGIPSGATLRLVLGMRGGPINTRRVPYDSASLSDLFPYSEGPATFLVFRDGDQLNFFQVVDRGDGTLSPLAESISPFRDEDDYESEPEFAAGAAAAGEVCSGGGCCGGGGGGGDDMQRRLKHVQLKLDQMRLSRRTASMHRDRSSASPRASSGAPLPPINAAATVSYDTSRRTAPASASASVPVTTSAPVTASKTVPATSSVPVTSSKNASVPVTASASVTATKTVPGPSSVPVTASKTVTAPVTSSASVRSASARASVPMTVPVTVTASVPVKLTVTSPCPELIRIGSSRLSRLMPPPCASPLRHGPASPAALPPVAEKEAKRKKRCNFCNKKTGLANSYQCRCGNNFCGKHRYAEVHSCPFDYKAEGRRLIKDSNPVIAASKLPKI